MKDVILFENKRITVTPRLFRAPRKTYRLSDIEKITLKRSVFVLSLPLSIGSACMVWHYGAYLYAAEILVCALITFVLPLLTWRIGTLSVTSKSLRDDDAITGWMPTLVMARAAIETVIFDQQHGHTLEASDEQ